MVITGTVRRFLEHYSDQVELIVFAVQTDHVSYCNLLMWTLEDTYIIQTLS